MYQITEAGRKELDDWMAELVAVPVKEYPQFEAALSELPVLEKAYGFLKDGKGLWEARLSEGEKAVLAPLTLLTVKPVLYAANVSDSELGTDLFQTNVFPFVEKRGRPTHDFQASDVRKRVENFLRHSDGKRLLIMVRR